MPEETIGLVPFLCTAIACQLFKKVRLSSSKKGTEDGQC